MLHRLEVIKLHRWLYYKTSRYNNATYWNYVGFYRGSYRPVPYMFRNY